MIGKEANELITALVDSELSDPERQAVESHLRDCSNCQNIYQEELELKRHIHSIGARVSAPPELRERILSDRRIFPPPAQSPLGWKGLLWSARVMARPGSFQWLEITQHSWYQLGHRRVNVHGPLNDGVGRPCVHDIQD